ncbi:MAG: hypothetical protein GY719_18400 [bacterium]|nr:hypothetical protein [bacterium]
MVSAADGGVGGESKLARAIRTRFDAAGLNPPSPRELAEALGVKPQILAGVQNHLIERGKLLRLPPGLIIATSAVEGVRRALIETGWDDFTVPQFKDRFDLSRKWAIPILEHLDSLGVTRRDGDRRRVVRSR